MCCQGHGEHQGHGCGGHGAGGFQRRFSTKEERVAELKDYLETIKAEAKAVEEQIAELEGGKKRER